MAQIFTANQVNHAYVVNSLNKDTSDSDKLVKPTKDSAKGASYVGVVKENGVAKSIYISQRGAAGLVRSDLIDLDKIMYIKATPAGAMARKKNAALITVNSSALDSGHSNRPYIGQDYILRLTFQNPVGMSPDHVYNKHAVVHVTSDISTASALYAKMAQSLVMNLSREAVKLLHVYLTVDNSSDVEVTSATQTLNGTYTGLKLVEAEQEWILGVKQDKPIIFKINGSTINNGTEEVVWEDVIYSNGLKVTGGSVPTDTIDTANKPNGGTVPNGHLAAELEYFTMGERADLYRQVGWPDCRITEYLADPTKEYDMIGIHYYYQGSNHAVQKSEKDITLLVPRVKWSTSASPHAYVADDTTNTSLAGLATEIMALLEGATNPEDSRYLTQATLFEGTIVGGYLPVTKKASDGTITIEESAKKPGDIS